MSIICLNLNWVLGIQGQQFSFKLCSQGKQRWVDANKQQLHHIE